MAAGGDAGRAMDVAAYVPLVGQQRCPRVQTDAHGDRTGAECLGEGRGRSDRTRRGREGEEEGVALRIHLDSAVGATGLPNDSPMLRERLRIALGAE
jgi:hypothetical protein